MVCVSSGKRSKNCMFSIDFNGILNKMAAPKSAKRDVIAITFQLKYFSLYGKGPFTTVCEKTATRINLAPH